jgi:hypothetical protein
MLANLSIMAPEQKAWFETKQAIIHECDAWSHIAMHDLSILYKTCVLNSLCPTIWNYCMWNMWSPNYY